MIQIKKTILTLALLLTAVTGAWADQLASSYSSNATLNAVTVSASMEVTIATGVTVTINNGLNIASGTLTVTGPGTLVVTGAKGNDGGYGFPVGGYGGNGGVAISGNIIVQGGATVTATGGSGGNGGNGAFGGNGGNGGNAFAGTLTYKGGTVTANGGSGGSGGWGDDEEAQKYAPSGSAGKAFAKDVDFTQTTVEYTLTDGSNTIGSVLNQTKVVISGSTPASSGPKVAWDKDKKTGSFTMPGGNVTLEPEYYPQAALTAAPTAINDVPATTDGAIVKAGTVANIGETTTAQGTLMYYVSPTALDDAALLALAADKWKADVPTAADLAQGQAYVYYYVRGNDGDTDETTFSDGDILAANAVSVTIAAAPLWNAEFDLTDAPEEDKAGKWSTDIPEGGVVKGTEVKVTYTGSKKVIGVKAEKKAKAILLDNTMTAWTAGTYAVPADGLTYSDAITVSGDVTLVLTDGETLTLNKGISLASGATLTIEGNGTMNVNGTNNSTASTVAGSTGTLVLTSGTLTAKGGNGQDMTDGFKTGASGGAAINGSVTVNGGSLTATGGNGGNCIGATIGPETNGGAGGAAISGDVTITDGAVAATGGNGGSIGASNYGEEVHGGAGGAAIGGNATLTGGTLTTTQGANGTGSLSASSVGTGGKAVAGTVTNNGGTVN